MEYKFGEYCLHTHSIYCGHGTGNLEDYVECSLQSDIKLLGFSEHCPVKENRWSSSRMPYEKMEDYLNDVDRQKEKYPSIKILKGFECDYLKEYKNYYKELSERVDYLISGVHFLQTSFEKDFALHFKVMGKKELFLYANQYIDSIESGLFSFLAHPDLFAIQYRTFDNEAKAISREIIECAIAYDLPLEVNGNGLIKDSIYVNGEYRVPYPIPEFWELAQEYPALKVIGTPDAHDPLNIKRFKDDCINFLNPFNIDYAICIEEDNKLIFK